MVNTVSADPDYLDPDYPVTRGSPLTSYVTVIVLFNLI